ncbi:MAG: DUF3987 domain-containing protein [Pyrinomonadaceae bacterium]|nr:DUF3987 domain-containing protein [Pyrinomonadaceae bacterium]
MTDLTPAHKMARTAHKNGLCVVPPKGDGSKAPASFWKDYQTERPEPAQIDRWYESGREGIGVVCGTVSGNLTMLECENEDTWNLLVDNAGGIGLDELLGRISDGWMEKTPGGGIHVYYRCEDCRGNKKLARRKVDEGIQVLIETRGEGGYTIISPSSGTTHPTGNDYVLVSGGPKTIETITPDDQHDLWQLCQVFDEVDVVKAEEPTYVGLLRPGDDYNNRASWRDILEPHGWRFLFERGGVWYLRRPGKDRGVSATVNWGGFDCLRNFSSSTALDTRMYTKFGVYTVLNHRGDFREAAKLLASKGYGSRERLASAGGEEPEPVPQWRTPDSLERPGFPSFPLHHFPHAIRDFCRAVSESVQVPYDYPALTILGALSVAARGRYEVLVQGTSHREPLVLQTVLFADSGTRKSNSFAIVKKPLTRYEREQRRFDEVQLAAWEIEFELAEKEVTAAKRGKGALPMVIESMVRDLDDIKRRRPIVTRLIADDVTPERLGTIIVEQNGPIGVMAPEGGFFGNISGRYNQGIPNMEYVLRGHNGEPLIIDRMGREAMVYAAFVTLAISLQPEIVNELASVPGFRGKGMAARLLPSFPASPVGQRDVRKSKAIPLEEEVRWSSILTTILNQAEEATVSEWGEYAPYVLVLSSEAKELYYLYSEHVERQLSKGGGLSTIRDWGGKMVGHALRIAGLFHLVERGSEAIVYPINKQSLADAIGVMEYFVPHAKYLLEKIDGTSYGEHLGELMKVLQEIPEPVYRASVTSRLRSHKRFKGNKEYINEALDELELLGYLRLTPEGSKVRVELNPSIGGITTYAAFDVPDVLADAWTFTYQEEADEDW